MYKVYFVSKFNTEEYFIQASNEIEVMEFLIFECYIFGRYVDRSTKPISELFDQLNKRNKKYRKSFCFARGKYFYVKEIVKTGYGIKKKTSPKKRFSNVNCIVM